jgi:hypothetical protein
MASSDFFRFAIERSRAAERMTASADPLRGRELNRVVLLCLGIPTESQQLYESLWDRAMAGQIDNFTGAGNEVLGVIDTYARVLDTVKGWVQAAEQEGQRVPRAAELARAADELAALRKEVVERWPWISERSIAEARAEIARGEFLELDDAFEQIAGVDKETWLKRVEEHKRRKQG